MNKNKLNFLKYGLLITTPIPFVSIASSCNNNSNNQNTNVNEQEKIDKAANAVTCEYRVDKTNVKATEAQSNQIEYKNYDCKLYQVVYISKVGDDSKGTLDVTFKLVSLSNQKLESKSVTKTINGFKVNNVNSVNPVDKEKIDKEVDEVTLTYKNINNSIKPSQVSLPQIEYHNFDQKLYKVVYITNKADDDEGTLNVTFRLVSLSNPKLESKAVTKAISGFYANKNDPEQVKIDNASKSTIINYAIDSNKRNVIKPSKADINQIIYGTYDDKLYKAVYVSSEPNDQDGILNVTLNLFHCQIQN